MGLPDSDYTRPDPAEYQLVLENGLIAYVAEADQVPLVTMSAFVRGGLVSDESQGAAESLQDALKNSGPSGTSSSPQTDDSRICGRDARRVDGGDTQRAGRGP
jgi:hypothetical protein